MTAAKDRERPADPDFGPQDQPRESFADFYGQRFAEMARLAFLMTGSEDAAEDLAQDAFVRIHRRWESVEQPVAYVRRAVVNACKSEFRRRGRERRRAAEIRLTSIELEPDELWDALETLPYRQRAAVVLRFYHDLPEREIARALGCRPGTVGSLIHRGLAQMRKVVEP